MKDRFYSLISGTVFGVVALLHLLRLANNWPFQVGPWSLPLWASWFCTSCFGRSLLVGTSPLQQIVAGAAG
jgi:hypothetical protein